MRFIERTMRIRELYIGIVTFTSIDVKPQNIGWLDRVTLYREDPIISDWINELLMEIFCRYNIVLEELPFIAPDVPICQEYMVN